MLKGEITFAQKVSIYGQQQKQQLTKQTKKQNKKTPPTTIILQVSYLLAYSSAFKVI